MSMIRGEPPGVSIVRAGEGEALWVVGDTYTLKATTQSTDGAYALIEASIPPGAGPPPHIHTREEEAFYVLDGELQISVGEDSHRVGTGDFVYLPRGTVHWFTNPGTTPTRTLILITPGGFEGYFQEIGKPAVAGELAPPFDPADAGRLAQPLPAYGGRIVAPTGAPVN